MYRLNTLDKGGGGCWVTLQELLLDNTGKGKKTKLPLHRRWCQSNSRRRDDWSVLSVKCVFLTCCDDIVTPPLFFFLLRRWDFFPCLLPPAASASLRDDIHHFCSMRFISSGLFTDFYCSVAIFQGLAWGRVERKKERKTHSDNQRPQQCFMTHCMLSLQEKWAGGKKNRIESHLFIPFGGYEHISCCAVTWTHLLLWPTSISGPLRGF